MAGTIHDSHTVQDSPTTSGDAAPRAGAQGDVAQTSKTLFDSLFQVHTASLDRNSADSKKDGEAMQGDNASVKLANQTNQLSESVKAYLAGGGDFSDAKGASLGQSLMNALRQERADHAADRKGDLEYSGTNGVPQQLIADLLYDSKQIGLDALDLNKTNLSAADRQLDLKAIEAGAAAITANIAEHGGNTGKDLKDALAESKVISADAAALASGKLTAEQSKVVIEDIATKQLLIQNEVGDASNETKYAQHDTAAIKAGGDMEAVLRSAMQSHSPKLMQQLGGMLEGYHNNSGKGVLDTVVQDRQADLRLEPGYIGTNNADNARNNSAILTFSDLYKKD